MFEFEVRPGVSFGGAFPISQCYEPIVVAHQYHLPSWLSVQWHSGDEDGSRAGRAECKCEREGKNGELVTVMY